MRLLVADTARRFDGIPRRDRKPFLAIRTCRQRQITVAGTAVRGAVRFSRPPSVRAVDLRHTPLGSDEQMFQSVIKLPSRASRSTAAAGRRGDSISRSAEAAGPGRHADRPGVRPFRQRAALFRALAGPPLPLDVPGARHARRIPPSRRHRRGRHECVRPQEGSRLGVRNVRYAVPAAHRRRRAD